MKFATNRHIEQVIFPPIVEIKRLVAGDKAPCGKTYIDLCQAVPDYPPAAGTGAGRVRAGAALRPGDRSLYFR